MFVMQKKTWKKCDMKLKVFELKYLVDFGESCVLKFEFLSQYSILYLLLSYIKKGIIIMI